MSAAMAVLERLAAARGRGAAQSGAPALREHGDLAVTVSVDAQGRDSERGGAAIAALYRAAIRFGVRPFELRDTSAGS